MQNGFVESFNGRMRDELLNEIMFRNLAHARVVIAAWVTGPVAFLCRSKCSFKPPCVRKRQGFSSPVLNGGVADYKSR